MANTRTTLITALFLIALSGLLLHYRIHNFMVADPLNPEITAFNSSYFLSFMFPLIDVVVVTALFSSRRTFVYGFLLNGIIVIYGTVLMAHYSISELTAISAPLTDWFIKSTLPDIGITWGDFFVGKALYNSYINTKA